jgi:iron complex transport system substrate-binding protein
LSPDLTEMLYGVGAFSRVVAVSKYDTYPPETAKLTRLGDLQTPSFEKLAGLRPDLVLVTKAQAPFLVDALKDLKLHVLTLRNQSIAQVYETIASIGQATGTDAAARRLIATTEAGINNVRSKTQLLPRPSVVLIVDRTPGTLRDLYAATGGSYLAELVEIAGGRIALPATEIGYRKLSKENLLALDPDVILDFNQAPPSRFAGNYMEAWRDMPELRAVRTHRVYDVNEDFVPHASQRVVQTAELFAKKLHPEIK